MKIWIYLNGIQQGPYTVDQLRLLPLTADTPVWYEGLAAWTPAAQAAAIAAWFRGGDVSQSAPETEQPEPMVVTVDIDTKPLADEAAAPAAQPPIAPQVAEIEKRPPTYIAWCILLTVLCCSPFAIAGIITGAMSSSRYSAGQYASARKLSEATEWMVILAIVFAIIGLPVTLAMSLL